MLCPHCGFDNAEGRNYCRRCTKPLAPEALAAKPTSPVAPRPRISVTPAPAVNKMAVASLAFSFLAFIVPLGIASVVMGHISRRRITASQGRETGTGIAFAGLILSYLQLLVVGVIFVIAVCLGYELNQKLDHDPYVRAALTERMLNGNPDHPSAAVMAKNGPNLMDALHLIIARQEDYRTEHDGNYACHINYLEQLGQEDELADHVRNSHYSVQVICTGADDQGRAGHYAVTGFPRTESNPPNSPYYCVDETKIIRRYSDAEGVSAVLAYQRHSCPEDGEPVE